MIQPPGAGFARFITDCYKLFKILITAFDIASPPPGAFLAELPPKGNLGGLVAAIADECGAQPVFLIQTIQPPRFLFFPFIRLTFPAFRAILSIINNDSYF